TVFSPPVAANAGTDLVHCNDGNFQLAGIVPAPAGALGMWSVVSSTLGATAAIFTDPTAYNSTVTGEAAGETLVLQCAIGNGVCCRKRRPGEV
ncbi:hypothetical protein ACWKWU_22865, partial [Chitinophaga lutea]